MKKALVIYHSKTGVTRSFGKEIHEFLVRNGLQSTFISINDFRSSDLENVGYLFLGCWTSGLFVILQHPEKAWVDFSKRLPDLSGKKIALFTTYTLASGSMFRGMRKRVLEHSGKTGIELKSRDGRLTESQKKGISGFIG